MSSEQFSGTTAIGVGAGVGGLFAAGGVELDVDKDEGARFIQLGKAYQRFQSSKFLAIGRTRISLVYFVDPGNETIRGKA